MGISGKDSAVAAIITKLYYPSEWETMQLFFNNTGADYPCVTQWLAQVESYLQKPIFQIDGNLPSIILKNTKEGRAFLPSRKARYCTKEAKIQPMEKWIGKERATLYTGLRYDEQDRRGYTPSSMVLVKHPLIEREIGLGGVYSILDAVKLLPPDFFWKTLYDRVFEMWSNQLNIFEITDFNSALSLHQKRILFSGRTRANCYFCFNQRLYEFVWLSETYPNLFESACAYEKDNYTWLGSESLRDLIKPARKEKIISDRAHKVFNQVSSIVFGKQLQAEPDLFDTPSCGLFCGK